MQRLSRDLKRKCIDVRKSNKEDEKPWEMTTRVLLKNVQSLRDCLDGCAAKGKEEITSFDVLRGLLNDSDKSLFQSAGKIFQKVQFSLQLWYITETPGFRKK